MAFCMGFGVQPLWKCFLKKKIVNLFIRFNFNVFLMFFVDVKVEIYMKNTKTRYFE